MTGLPGRFFDWLLNLAAIALLVAFVLLALHAANPRQTALDAFSRSAPEEAAFLDRTGGGDPSPPSAPGLFMALDQEAGDTKADGAGPTDSPVSGLASSADLALADYALPTPHLIGRPSKSSEPFGGLHPVLESWYRGVAAGKASHMGAGFGPAYLALPIGPGYRVEIVGAGGRVTRVSTDSGPSLAMQRPPYNRIADLNVWDFLAVCGVPLSMGLCEVSVTVLGRG